MKIKKRNYWRYYHKKEHHLDIPEGDYDIQYRGKGDFVLSKENFNCIVNANDLKPKDKLCLYEAAAEKMGEALAAISELATLSFSCTTLGIAADAIGHNYNLHIDRYNEILRKAQREDR